MQVLASIRLNINLKPLTLKPETLNLKIITFAESKIE